MLRVWRLIQGGYAIVKERETFASRLGFVLISAGCAIGLGNVWRFPYIVGQYGGAAFVLIYLLFLVIMGLPIMAMEFSVGRASRKSILASFQVLEPKGSKWHWYGWFGMAGNYLLMMFYTTIAGWLLLYFFKVAAGEFRGLDAAGVENAFGVNPGQGPSLIFVTLPNVFNAMPGGQLWGALFFVFLFFAALSTVTAVFENILACWMDRFGISRGRAVLANLVLIFLLSLPCLLGNNLWSGVKALGMGIMDWEDFLVSNNLLPIGSMIYLLFCCVSKKYGWGYDHFLEEANQGRGVRFPAQFRLYFKYVLPVIVLIIFIMGYWDKFKPFIVAALGA